MDPIRYRLIKEILLGAIERSGEDRTAYLTARCEGDEVLFAEVLGLLENEEAGPFLAEEPTPGPNDMIGRVLGAFRIEELIGEGGMGAVYRATQSEPIRRQVAVKIIKAGMDSKEVIARFETERQALALMNHPNVAQIYDAGATEQGRPYFVMELVSGEPITTYCDRNRLDIRHRLELFIKVCEAIHHAHQKGIIHRDIKPSNVLVTELDGGPMVKVIDFGVAKATQHVLTNTTYFTVQGILLGTPAYMSPEQAEMTGHRVDQTSDVYSLGALLYELLTGVPPFSDSELRRSGISGIHRAISEQVPPKPSSRVEAMGVGSNHHSERTKADSSQLKKTLDGELDWVTMRAMEKEKSRRYRTASELGLDLRRFLEGTGVEAGPPSLARRLQASRWRPLLRLGIPVLLVLLLAVSSFLLWPFDGEEDSRKTVLVLPFIVEGQEKAAGEFVGRSIAEALVIRFLEIPELTVLPVPVIHEEGRLSKDNSAKMGKRKGARWVVSGRVDRGSESNQLVINCLDVNKNSLLWAAKATVADREIDGIVDSSVEEMLAKFGAISEKKYEYYEELSGSPEMASSMEFGQYLTSLRGGSAHEILNDASELLLKFPGEFDAHVHYMFAVRRYFIYLGRDADLESGFTKSYDYISMVDPNNPYNDLLSIDVYRSRVQSLRILEQLLDRDDLTQAFKAHVHRVIGGLCTDVGNHEKAIEAYEQALALLPLDVESLSGLSRVYYRQGNHERGLTLAIQATSLARNYPWLLDNVAWNLLGLKRYDEAAEYFIRSFEIDGSQTTGASASQALFFAQRFDEASHYAELAEKANGSKHGWYNLACYYSLVGEVDRAFSCLKKAFKLGYTSEYFFRDTDLDNLRSDERFLQYESQMRSRIQSR